MVLASLPVAAYLALLWAFLRSGEGLRSGALRAAIYWGAFLALVTELLSAVRAITRPSLAIAWATLTVGALLWGGVLRQTGEKHSSLREDLSQIGRFDLALLGWVVLSIVLIGINAVLAPPNTWDAMCYHMSRVAEWMTNRDVDLYPTFYSAQLFLSPWAEYAILHLDLLFGADRLVNLVEWLSMVGTVIGVSLVAKRLGGGVRAQILAAIACATIPEGILEASGAMNTYVGAFWIVVTIYCLLRWNEKQSWSTALEIGTAAGLAIMSKGTAFMFLPFTALACWWMGSSRARKLLFVRLPILLLVVIALNGPFFIRNYRLSGSPLGFSSPLGGDPERVYSNSRHSVSITYANIVKNLALHVGTPVDPLNTHISRLIVASLRILGIDPNDKASTYRGGFNINAMSSHESLAGNPLQLVLICIASAMLFDKRIGNRNLRAFMVGVGGSFVLFCALIRWQAWNSRYHLPLFALGLAVVGVVLERGWPLWVTKAVALLLLFSALPFLFLNSLRPLAPWKDGSVLRKPRIDFYFEDMHQSFRNSFLETARAVASTDCNEVGIDSSLDFTDYPLFALLNAGHGDRKVRYAGVRNLTTAYARPDAKPPCAVVCLFCANVQAKWAKYKDVGGRASIIGDIAIFSKNGVLPNTETLVLPVPFEPERILQQLGEARDALHAVGLGALEKHLQRAGRDWPEKWAELFGRWDGLYCQTIGGWGVRDSVDPMRREGESIDYSKVDPYQWMAATEILANWQSTIHDKIRDLNQLADQLYWSGETALLGFSPTIVTSEPCQVRVRVTQSLMLDASSKKVQTSAYDRLIDLPSCSCLAGRTKPGDVLVRKPFGKFDSEAENFTRCVPGNLFSTNQEN
jgi:hypothetical protein